MSFVKDAIAAAKKRHSLLEAVRRTGYDIPEDATGDWAVFCPMTTPGSKHTGAAMQLHLTDGESDWWHCFSCRDHGVKNGGDVVEWVCQTEGVEWDEAIRILDSGRPLTNHAPDGVSREAVPAGTTHRRRTVVTAPDGTEEVVVGTTPKERLLELLKVAGHVYTRPDEHARAVEYLLGRKESIDVTVLEDATGRKEVGCTSVPGVLTKALRGAGFTDEEMVDSGLFAHARSGDGIYETFRERMMVPCRDSENRLVGFYGRRLVDPPEGDEVPWYQKAKWRNLPTTRTYDKSVDQYDPLGRIASPGPANVVVVEGTLDAMAMAVAAIRAGVPDMFRPITSSGGALRPAQMERVLDLAGGRTPVIAYDGDSAGAGFTYAPVRVLLHAGREVAVTRLPDGMDPAEYLAKYGDGALAAWTTHELPDDDDWYKAVRPTYGAKWLVQDTQEGYLLAAEKPDTARSAAKVLATLHGQLLDARSKLPESAWMRFDTQVAPALATMAVADSVLRAADDARPKAELAVDVIATSLAWTNDFDQATQRVLIPALMEAAHRRLDATQPELAAYIDDGFKYVTADATKLETETPMYRGMSLVTARMEM